MYLNQWTKNFSSYMSGTQYRFYLHDRENSERNSDLNTVLGIYEK